MKKIVGIVAIITSLLFGSLATMGCSQELGTSAQEISEELEDSGRLVFSSHSSIGKGDGASRNR